MATEAPDPRSFKTWEDAFQHPIPVVRKLENQLRSNAGENREKLRSLVGASYRDLLSTAETIIDMEVRMQQVEFTLAKVGQGCNTRNLDRISRNATTTHTQNRNRNADRFTFASQLSVLRNSLNVTTRLLDKPGENSLLLVAKVLVIARLLHKALDQRNGTPPILEQLGDKIRILRERLLRRINKRLASSAGDSSSLIEGMCAYALANSSTPTDILHRFHTMRLERITKLLQHRDDLKENGITSLKLCIQTCQDTQTIFPRRLADALAKLKGQPLIQDPDIRALYELNLDIHDRWIEKEAQNYTPWPRHDELTRVDAEKILHTWSKKAMTSFLNGIKSALEDSEKLTEVASLRQELIETWIQSGSRMAGIKPANVLDDLRDAMNQQLELIVQSRTQNLSIVAKEISSTLESWLSNDTQEHNSLWASVSRTNDTSDGAQVFKSTISNTHQGRDMPVLDITSSFDKWMDSVLEVKSIIRSMREMRWDDPFADEVELSDSDEEFTESKQTLLSSDDPSLLEDVVRDALGKTLTNLRQSFVHIIGHLKSSGNETTAVSTSIFILRLIREFTDRVSKLRTSDQGSSLPLPFSSETSSPLYITLVTYILKSNIRRYKKTLATQSSSKSNIQVLWEGNPPLPAQPSPIAFRFLHGLVKAMSDCGADLWAQDGVNVLKVRAAEEVGVTLKEFLEYIKTIEQDTQRIEGPKTKDSVDENDVREADAQPASDTESEKPGPSSTAVTTQDQIEARLKQILFDALFIQRYLAPPSSTSNENVQQSLEQAVGALAEASRADGAAVGRLRDKAREYGRKTYLLFALLA